MIDWCAAAGGGGGGGGGGGVDEVILENEHVRAGGRGGGSDGPRRARLAALAPKSAPGTIFPVPKRATNDQSVSKNAMSPTIFVRVESNGGHTLEFRMNLLECGPFIGIPSPA